MNHADIKNMHALKPLDYSDVGQAKVLKNFYADRIWYTPATNYLYYNGKKWVESETKVRSLVHELTEFQLQDAIKFLQAAQQSETDAEINKDSDGKKMAANVVKAAKRYLKFVLDSRSTLRINATLTEAKPLFEAELSWLDRDGLLLNTPGGIIDLRTGILEEHHFDRGCTKITNAELSDKGTDLFSDFLKTITCNNAELENYLQLIAGMFAIGVVYEEKLVIAHGCGRNGKSTFFNLLAKVLGDYSGNLSAETLTANCRKNKSPEYAELRGKRLVIAAELEEGTRLDTAIVKKLCSTDTIFAEKKYKDPFSFTPSHTIVLYTNHLPNVGTSDGGTWRRLIVIPFKAVITGDSDIRNYTEYLFENAGGAVLKWIVEGARKFIANNCRIDPPDVVKQEIEMYREANDWLNNYMDECCIIGEEYEQPSGPLYEHYRNHCKRYGEYPRKQSDFKKALENAGYKYIRTSQCRIFRGFKLKPEREEFQGPYVGLSKQSSVSGGDSTEQNFQDDDDYTDVEF